MDVLRKRISFVAGTVAIIAVLLIAACGGDDSNETLTLSFSGIEPLVNDYHYEGWAIIDDSPVSTGKFNVDDNGNLVDLAGKVIKNGEFDTGTDLTNASAIVLTIKPSGDTDTVPTSTHYLSGGVLDLAADLTVGHGASLGDSFANASGKYILATPSNGQDNNETSSIWFIDLSSGSPRQGLQLPTLPDGWEYEGWAVIEGVPVTTGRFTDAGAPDLSAPFTGPGSTPPFPGEDFLQDAPSGLAFPTDIRGGKAVISIEPEPDDSGAPFTLKPLVGDISDDAEDHVTYELGNNAGGFPTGQAVIS